MSDQLRWFKVWTSAARDADLRALRLEDFARWVLFGVYVIEHGTRGRVVLHYPSKGVLDHLRITYSTTSLKGGWERLLSLLQRFPNMTIERDGDTVTVAFRNWRKYQEDTSWKRMKEYRERRGRERNEERNGGRNEESNESDARPGGAGLVSPLSPLSPPTQIRHDWPPGVDHRATDWLPGRWPYETFHHDCPERAWRGHCVRAEYADAHPGQHPVTMGGRPKQCPKHREAEP